MTSVSDAKAKAEKIFVFLSKPLAKRAAQCYNTKALVPPSHRRDNDTSLYRRSSAAVSGYERRKTMEEFINERNAENDRGHDQREPAQV